MSKHQRSVDEQQRPVKWVKFVGANTEFWRKALDQISIEKIPFEYVDEVRFHFESGRTYTHSVTSLNEKDMGDLIEKVIASNRDLNAIEYIVDLDKMHSTVVDQVKIFLEGSRDD